MIHHCGAADDHEATLLAQAVVGCTGSSTEFLFNHVCNNITMQHFLHLLLYYFIEVQRGRLNGSAHDWYHYGRDFESR